jgi:hypothetical protein
MKTPRTEAVIRMAVGPMREYAIIEHTRNLERENIVLYEALEEIKHRGPIMGSTGDYLVGQLDILATVSSIASLALSKANKLDVT